MNKHHFLATLISSISLIALLTVMIWQTASEAATPGVVGYWSLDTADISGASALERSGSGYNLTISGSKSQVTGKYGQALAFVSGESDYLSTAAIPDSYRNGSNTFALWIKPQNWGANSNVHFFNWLKGDVHDYTDGFFADFGNIIRLQYPGVTFGTAASSVWVSDIDLDSYPLNQWMHLALVQNSTAKTVTLYLNGTVAASTSYSGTVDLSMHDTIKIFDPGNSTTASAAMDEIYIFSKALTASEITQLYNDTYSFSTPTPTPTPAAPTLTLTASPATIPAGSGTTLSWTSSGAASCTASGGWSGSKAVSGSQVISSIAQTTTYTLTCANSGGTTVQRSATVTVSTPSPTPTPTPAPSASPTLNLTADKTGVAINGSANLIWSSTNTASCTASGGWSGSKPVSGTYNTGALATNTNYTLTCKAPDTTQANWFNQGYGYRKKLTVDNTKVAGTGTLTNYPILVALTDPGLKSTASGGKVTSASGYDIIFTSNTGTTPLPHEIESYNPATGAIEMWVSIPSLSGTTDTDFFLYYGNSAISTSQENTAALWAAYEGVWHLNNDFTDSAKTHHGTNNGTVDDAGVVGRARDFSDDSIRIPDGTATALDQSANMTISAWIKPDTAFTSWNKFIAKGDSGSTMAYELLVDTDNGGRPEVAFHSSGSTGYAFSTVTMNTTGSQWYHVSSVKAGADVSIFTNGTETESWTQAQSGTPRVGTHDLYFGSNYDGWGEYFNGDIDEVRIAKTNLSADWINTEYQTITAKGAGLNKFLKAPAAEEVRVIAGSGATVTKSVTITVIAAPTLAFSADKTSVPTGGSATLSWTSANTDSCTASDGWIGSKPLSGTADTGPLNANKRYTLTCAGKDGSSIQKTVDIAVIPAPQLNLMVTNDPVPEGQPAQLSWSGSALSACMASDGWTGTKAASGTATSGPLSADTVFTLTCTGQDGSTISKSATAHVILKPKLELTATKTAVSIGETTTLSWFAANVSSCTASGAWNGVRALSGTEETYPIKFATTYTLGCVGTDGSSIQKSITITIDEPNITIFPGICHAFANESEFPVTQSYAPPYNVHSDAAELLMNVSCSESGATANLGNGNNSLYVYESGYIYVDQKWSALKYDGLNRVADTWLKGNATLSDFPMTKSQLIKPSLLLAYFCQWSGSEWKCGCKNTTCSNSLWSLQGFQAEYQLN